MVEAHVAAAARLLDLALGAPLTPTRERGALDRAAELVEELLATPDLRPGAWEAAHVRVVHGGQWRRAAWVTVDVHP